MSELLDQLQAALQGRYRLEHELGGGGMSRVFVAEEVGLGRKVVVKVLPPELAAGLSVERFNREIQLAAGLQHPHIVPLLAAGEAGGLLYYTMPLVQGESLRAKLAREGELPINETIRLLRDVADALAYAHEHGVVHRDIKPDNVLVSGHHSVVTDFGVAKALSESTGRHALTSMGVALGTPAYMAPEQASADPHVDHRADIYALGAMAYEMLTGSPPFSGVSPQAVLAKQVTTAPEPVTSNRATVPPAFAALVMRCLEKKPADRYQNAEELLQQLDVLATPSGGLTPTSAVPVPAASSRRSWWIAGAAVLAIAAALGLSRLGGKARSTGTTPALDTAGIAVAVLPFENVGGGPDAEPFADGMTEQLMTTLGAIPGLRVAGRTSSFAFKGKAPEPREIGEKLHVAMFTSGSVRRAGSVLRVQLQLINVSDGLSRWSGSFDGNLKTAADVFKVQDDIARSVATALGPQLGRKIAEAPATRPTDDLQAYDLYLKGRYFWTARRGQDFPKAEQLFKQAIARDPKFARAHAGLADLYAVWPHWASGIDKRTDREVTELAERSAREALRLDSSLAEPHAALGYVMLYPRHDWAGSEAEFKQAIARAPRYATAHHWYAWVLMLTGRTEEELAESRIAVELEPLSPIMTAFDGMRLYYAGRFGEAVSRLRTALELDPTSGNNRFLLFEALMLSGAHAEGIREITAVLPPGAARDSSLSLAWAEALAGRPDKAERAVRGRASWPKGRYSDFSAAILLAAVGDSVRAAELTSRMVGGVDLINLCHPGLAAARRQPLIREAMKRIGLPPNACGG